MRVMMFPQWFQLLQSIFTSFLLLLQRIQVWLRLPAHLLRPASPRPASPCPLLPSFQATLSVIRNVVLQVQLAAQRQLLEEAPDPQRGEPSRSPALPPPGEAELAYLTHEGLFISDALSGLQQPVQDQDQNQNQQPASRGPQNQPEAAGADSAPEAAGEPTFMYVCELIG